MSTSLLRLFALILLCLVPAAARAQFDAGVVLGAIVDQSGDRSQLEDVLTVCLSSPSLSAAGRVLFDRSLARKRSVNDADRLRKYLARFGLDWQTVKMTEQPLLRP